MWLTPAHWLQQLPHKEGCNKYLFSWVIHLQIILSISHVHNTSHKNSAMHPAVSQDEMLKLLILSSQQRQHIQFTMAKPETSRNLKKKMFLPNKWLYWLLKLFHINFQPTNQWLLLLVNYCYCNDKSVQLHWFQLSGFKLHSNMWSCGAWVDFLL